MKTLTASDCKSLIRLASSLPKGSEDRRAILAGLKIARKIPDAFRLEMEKVLKEVSRMFNQLKAESRFNPVKMGGKPVADMWSAGADTYVGESHIVAGGIISPRSRLAGYFRIIASQGKMTVEMAVRRPEDTSLPKETKQKVRDAAGAAKAIKSFFSRNMPENYGALAGTTYSLAGGKKKVDPVTSAAWGVITTFRAALKKEGILKKSGGQGLMLFVPLGSNKQLPRPTKDDVGQAVKDKGGIKIVLFPEYYVIGPTSGNPYKVDSAFPSRIRQIWNAAVSKKSAALSKAGLTTSALPLKTEMAEDGTERVVRWQGSTPVGFGFTITSK